jgi:hypothetical protein
MEVSYIEFQQLASCGSVYGMYGRVSLLPYINQTFNGRKWLKTGIALLGSVKGSQIEFEGANTGSQIGM